MNLYLFPETASLDNGYGIAVSKAYKMLNPNDEDMVIWYTNCSKIPYLRSNDKIIRKMPFISFKRFVNIIKKRPSLEVTYSDLLFLKNMDFENIHCNEVVFYSALRKIFPDNNINVRFHNCFARIKDRQRLLKLKLSLKFQINLDSFYNLERDIFNDRNVHKIFISEEDRNYYTSMMGYETDSEVWGFNPNLELMLNNRKPFNLSNKIVWLGGVATHKSDSLEWFIKSVFPKIRDQINDVEFHLWGTNTNNFDNHSEGIYGHGYYDGEELPLKGEALYINPDVIGGGIKLKLITYFEQGVPFITTPFGFEGYLNNLVDNKYCHVIEPNSWSNKIIELLKKY